MLMGFTCVGQCLIAGRIVIRNDGLIVCFSLDTLSLLRIGEHTTDFVASIDHNKENGS